MRVLVGCECTGTVRDAFARLGHDAWSCDLRPSQTPGQHIQGDLLKVIKWGGVWDLGIYHPECTYIALSGIHWNYRVAGRDEKTEAALEFVRALMACDIPHWALENPKSLISSRIRPFDQEIQPYEFGHDASKTTWLWLQNVPALRKDPKLYVPPRIVVDENGREYKRWANQTDSGQNREPPADDRWLKRAKTYEGIADAMAIQWTEALTNGWVKQKELF